MKKQITSLLLVLTMSLSMCIPTFAATENVGDKTLEDSTFIPMTREAYIANKAQSEGLSYEAAMAEIDANIDATMSSIPTLLDGFEGGAGSTDEYGVNTAYGYIVYVKPVPKSGGFLHVRMAVAATVISGPPGRYIADIGSDVLVQAGYSGTYTVTGTGDATLSGIQTVYITCTGVAEISETIAASIGMSAEIIEAGIEVSGTSYIRYPFTTGATYRV